MARISNDAYGEAITPDTVRLERLLPGPPERLWAWLTEAGKRRQWFAGGQMEPRVGGTAKLFFRHKDFADEPTPEKYKEMDEGITSEVRITAWDPPRTLAMSWPEGKHESEVTFELFAEGSNVLLVVTHARLKDRAQMANVASGWHAHLAALEDVLSGGRPKGFWTNVQRLEAAYGERLGLS